MARIDVRLYASNEGATVYLRPAPAYRESIDIHLYASNDGTNVYLRPPGWRLFPEAVAAGGGGGPFPTQYAGLRVWDNGAVVELCLVDTADAATGMGGVPMIRRASDTKAVYLVETIDPDASTVYFRTTAGTKAIRRKT